MSTVKIKGFVHKTRFGCGFDFHIIDMSEYGFVCVGPAEFEYELPADFEPVAAEVAMLKKKQDAIKSEAALALDQIDQRIQSLLCIENNPSVTA